MTSTLAGQIIAGNPAINLADVIGGLTEEQVRAALLRVAAIVTGDIPHEAGTLMLAEADAESGQGTDAYEWDDDPEFPGWYDVTGRQFGPFGLDQVTYPDGADGPARRLDDCWLHRSAVVVAMLATESEESAA